MAATRREDLMASTVHPPLHTLGTAIARLQTHYGAPEPLPTTDPFELVLWENVAYLAPHARRLEAFRQLRHSVGTSPAAILAANKSALERVTAHGILKGDFAAKLRECARIARPDNSRAKPKHPRAVPAERG